MPEDYGPPAGARAFSVRVQYGFHRREVAVDRLTLAELQWVARTVLAVLEARSQRNETAG